MWVIVMKIRNNQYAIVPAYWLFINHIHKKDAEIPAEKRWGITQEYKDEVSLL